MTVAPIKTIAIIGAGNGGCAAAAHLSRRGFDIRLYGRSRATTEPLSAIGGIEYEGAAGEGFAPLPLITNDAGAAVAGADLVLSWRRRMRTRMSRACSRPMSSRNSW